VTSGSANKALDRLYSAPLDQFTALRRELSAALRASGDAETSRVVAAAAKPTRTVWGLNQVARQRAELLRALFKARDAAAEAQRGAEAAQIRATVREYRDRAAEVVGAVRQALADAGVELTPAQARRIGETLQAASAEGPDARARLLAGRLAQDVDVDPFAGIEAGSTRRSRSTEPPRKDALPREREGAEAKAREREAQRQREERTRRTEEARARIAALGEEVREARAAARRAEVAAMRAQNDAEQARRHAADVEARWTRAREEQRETETERRRRDRSS
jgi:hypothetical protein